MVNTPNLNAKKGEEGYTTAYQGGVLITDASGNVVDRADYGTEAGNAAFSGKTLYKTDSGYTTKLPEAYAEFDSSGDLVIHAPKEITDMQSFQTNFLNNSALKQLSAAYKIDPNYQFPDPDDDSKTISVQDQLFKLNEGLLQYSQSAQKLADARSEMARTEKNGDRYNAWTLDQVATALTMPQNNTDRVRIPDFILNQNTWDVMGLALQSLPSWDEETKSVSKEDLLKYWWSLDYNEPGDLLARLGALDMYINYSDARDPESKETDYSMQAARFADPEQAAIAYSLREFLDSADATANTPVGVNRKVRDIVGTELYSAAAQLSAGLLSFAAGVTDIATKGVSAAVTAGRVVAPTTALAEGMADKATELEQSVDRMNDDLARYNTAAAVVGDIMQTLGNLGAIVLSEAATAAALSPVTAKLDSAEATLSYIEKNGTNIAKGAEFAMKAWPVDVAKRVAGVAATLTRMGNGLLKFTGEVLTDAAVDNPGLMSAIMSGDDVSDETKVALMEEAAFNGVGLAAGLSISRGLVKFANTEVGKALNAASSVYMAKAQVKASDHLYKLRSAIAKMPLEQKFAQKAEDAILAGDPVKAARYQKLRMQVSLKNELRDANAVLAALPAKETEAVMEQIEKIRTLNAAYDMFAQGGKQTLNAIMASDRILASSSKNATDALEKALKRQTEAGLTAAKASRYGSSGLSIEGSQYVSLSHRLEIARRAAQDSASSLHDAAIKALPVYEKQMNDLIEKMPEAYRAALDEYATKLRTFYNDMTDFAISEGLISEELIESYRANSLFADNNYMRVVVEDDVNKLKLERADGLIKDDHLLDIKHLSLPAKEQTFVDPEITRYWYSLEIAKSYNAKRLAESALAATGATPTVMASDKEIKLAREVNSRSTEVTKAVDKHYKEFINTIDANITLKSVGELKGERTALIATGTKRRAVERQINGLYKTAAVNGMSAEDMTALFKKNGVSSGSAYDDFMIGLGDGGKQYYDAWYKESSTNFKNWLRKQRNISLGYKIGVDKAASRKVSFEEFNQLANAQKNFRRAFDEQSIINDKKLFADNKVLSEAKRIKDNTEDIEGLTEAQEKLKAIEDESKEKLASWRKARDGIKDQLRDTLDAYVENISKEGDVIASTRAMSEYGEGDPDAIARYLALRELRKGKNLNSIKDSLAKKLKKALPGSATTKELDAYTDSLNEAVESLVNEEYRNARLALDEVGSKVIDKKEWADEIKSLQKKIADAREMDTVIKVSDGNGGEQLVEVSPNLAFLYTYRPRRVVQSDIVSRFNQLSSRLFRFGTTTFSSKSFFNQLMRDSGNAFYVGNAWRGIQESADNLVDVWGESIVQELKNFEPERYERLARGVEEAGLEATTENLARAEVEGVQAASKQIAAGTTETELYRMTGRSGGDVYERMQTSTKNIADKLDDIFNGKRERYLRERVFMSNLNTALEQGYTYKQARDIATNMMQNATTNFSRSLFMLDAIADNVPYIRASINGTTSFWRLFALDPVGVAGRILGGMMLPHWYLLGQSLADPENAEIYANIPEYEKMDSLVYVIRGHKVSIPIPQELSPVIAPFRQFIEYLYGAQKNSFWDLMSNDLLALSPVDLTGFSNVDINTMTSDPTILDRINRGTTRVISQLAPVPVKAAWIAQTGTDPYTGKKIADTSYTYVDPDTGEEIPMGYKQGAFAETVAGWLNNDNAAIVSKVVSTIFGTTGEDVLDTFTSIFQNVTSGTREGADPLTSVANSFIQPQLSNAVGVFYDEEYNRVDSLWRQAIRGLEERKNAITESKEWKDINSALSQATSDNAIKELRAKRQNMIDSFNQDVANTVQRLQSEYGGTFDRYKMASVMQLLNFSTNTDFDLSNQYLRDLSSDVYYAGRSEAVRTMQKLGITGTTDFSIFGYYKRNSDGSIGIRYNQPTVILDMANTVYSAKDIEKANLEKALNDAGITRGKMFSSEYYSATTKAAKKQYKANWNKQVVTALAPYIESVGVDEVLNNSEIIDMLDNYLFVDNPYNAKSYIKELFKGE